MGLERATIPGGRYRRARLKGEPPAVYERIGRTFEEMAAAIADLDRARPWIEFYRARDEIDLLIPIA
jgi:DNA gyrase inhibitor GyrI